MPVVSGAHEPAVLPTEGSAGRAGPRSLELERVTRLRLYLDPPVASGQLPSPSQRAEHPQPPSGLWERWIPGHVYDHDLRPQRGAGTRARVWKMARERSVCVSTSV